MVPFSLREASQPRNDTCSPVSATQFIDEKLPGGIAEQFRNFIRLVPFDFYFHFDSINWKTEKNFVSCTTCYYFPANYFALVSIQLWPNLNFENLKSDPVNFPTPTSHFLRFFVHSNPFPCFLLNNIRQCFKILRSFYVGNFARLICNCHLTQISTNRRRIADNQPTDSRRNAVLRRASSIFTQTVIEVEAARGSHRRIHGNRWLILF